MFRLRKRFRYKKIFKVTIPVVAPHTRPKKATGVVFFMAYEHKEKDV